MRKTWITIILLLACHAPAIAEARSFGDVFAGYSLLNGNLLHQASGWNVALAKNFGVDKGRPWFGIRGDISAYHQSVSLGHNHVHDFLAGPQIFHSFDHFTVSAHGLVGISHTGGSLGSHNGFSSAIGGALDWDINPLIAIRIAQIDYHQAQLFGGTQQNVRFSAGVVLRFIGMFDPARPAPPPPPPNEPNKAPKSVHR
jgi:hypothetical protein